MDLEDLRLAVYDDFARDGRAAASGDLADRFGVDRATHACNVGNRQPPAGDQVAHFLVPVAHMWDDVIRTCSHQRLFCSIECVDAWCRRTGTPRGYVMDLATLWRLASHWYDGRLHRGYERREPAAAKRYFREVGLSGPFWGL